MGCKSYIERAIEVSRKQPRFMKLSNLKCQDIKAS